MLTTRVWFFPYHCGSICQECSNCRCCATNLLNIPKLLLDCCAVPTTAWSAPNMQCFCFNPGRSLMCQECSKSIACCINLLNILELIFDCCAAARHGATNLLNTVQPILDCCAVTTKVRIAPCHHGSICQNGSKGILCATNLLHVLKLSSDCCAIPTTAWNAPCHHSSICQDRSKSIACCMNLLNVGLLCCPHHS